MRPSSRSSIRHRLPTRTVPGSITLNLPATASGTDGVADRVFGRSRRRAGVARRHHARHVERRPVAVPHWSDWRQQHSGPSVSANGCRLSEVARHGDYGHDRLGRADHDQHGQRRERRRWRRGGNQRRPGQHGGQRHVHRCERRHEREHVHANWFQRQRHLHQRRHLDHVHFVGTACLAEGRGRSGQQSAGHEALNNYYNEVIDALFLQYLPTTQTASGVPGGGQTLQLASTAFNGTSITYHGVVTNTGTVNGNYAIQFTDPTGTDTNTYNVYYPWFAGTGSTTSNAPDGSVYTPMFGLAAPPQWIIDSGWITQSASQMIFACDAVFADNTARKAPSPTT